MKYLKTLDSSLVIDLQNEATVQLLQESILVFLHAKVLSQILDQLKSKKSNNPRQITRFQDLLESSIVTLLAACLLVSVTQCK